MGLIDLHELAENPSFQRRVKMASLQIAVSALTTPAPDAAAAGRLAFARQVAGDPDRYTRNIAFSLAASTRLGSDETQISDEAMLTAMESLFSVFAG